MSVTYQQVLDAIDRIDMHHVQGTAVVICALVTTDGRVVLGVGSNEPGEEDFNIVRSGDRARQAANNELARQLEQTPVAEGAANGN